MNQINCLINCMFGVMLIGYNYCVNILFVKLFMILSYFINLLNIIIAIYFEFNHHIVANEEFDSYFITISGIFLYVSN